MAITGLIKGLHHITATVNDAQEDYDFYTKLLGLRLVKETVNFDNERVYHFYYANKTGLPSTVFTTFPYKDQGVRNGIIGTGQASHTAFSIPTESIPFWKDRLEAYDILFTEGHQFDLHCIGFKDPSGLNIQLISTDDDQRQEVWSTPEITADEAIRGMHNTTLLVADRTPTVNFLQAFGYRVVKEDKNLVLMEVGEGGAGNMLLVEEDTNALQGLNGLGTIHHVAHRVDNIEASKQIKSYMENEWNTRVTDVLDRKYFQSIYFRIPGGILFEVATVGPGFAVDEPVDSLGSSLKLPDWQEPNRERIEANLLKYKK